jgi:hypothetical protein
MPAMKALVRALWAGEVPLVRAYWEYGMLYGLLVNFFATIGLFALLTTETPAMVAAGLGLGLPAIYNFFILVAVWRSAERYQGRRLWADLARSTSLVLVVIATLL